jgi:hypothetical protein
MNQTRCYLYSSDCPGGRIFEGADAIADAQENGWKDSPDAVAEPETKAPAKKKASKKVAPKKVAAGDNSS